METADGGPAWSSRYIDEFDDHRNQLAAARDGLPLYIAAVSLLAYELMAILEIGLKTSTLPVVALGTGIGVDYGMYIYGRPRSHLV